MIIQLGRFAKTEGAQVGFDYRLGQMDVWLTATLRNRVVLPILMKLHAQTLQGEPGSGLRLTLQERL
jgi:hypothetical protein